MPALLYGILSWAMSGFLANILVGAGISVLVFTGFSPMIESFLNDAISQLNGLPQIAIQFFLLSGAGDALSMMGSALLTRVAMDAAAISFGLKSTS
jgi:hypothetical protein